MSALARKRYLIAAAIAVTVTIVFIAWKAGGADDPVRKGGDWLAGRLGSVGDPGVLWAMTEMNDAECGDDGLRERIRESFVREFGSHPTERAYAPLVGLPETPLPSSDELKSRSAYYDDILLPIIYCKRSQVPAAVYSAVFEDGAAGYDLTHKFLAMHFLKKFGCEIPERYDLASSTGAAARKIAAEQEEETFDDLYAERAAMLANFGYKDLVTDVSMATLDAYQHHDGGWGDERIARGDSNPHTTALALWAVGGYRGLCPF